jgi:hypothetical protein
MFSPEHSVTRRFDTAISKLFGWQKHKIQVLTLLLCNMFVSEGWAQSVALDFDGQNDSVTLSSLPQQWPSLLNNGFSVTLQARLNSYGSSQRLFFIQQDGNNFATAMVSNIGVVTFYLRRDGIIYLSSPA